MDETYRMLLERRTVRSFQSKAIPEDILDRIILAGKYAPSAMGLQNRHFTIVQDRALLNDIVAATEKSGGKFSPAHIPFYNAPDVVVVSAPENFKYNREDAACAAQNLLLAAYTFGVGSCYICSVLPGLQDENVRKRLKLPEGYVPCGCVSLGYPAAKAPEPKPRRTDDITRIP